MGGGLVAALAVALVGCSTDPCDGKSDTCITARVEGAIPPLTFLRVTVDGAGQRSSPDPAGAAFRLPAKLAIVLAPSVTSPARVTIDALDGTVLVGSSGPIDVPFAPGAHLEQLFTLGPELAGDL